MSSHPLRLTKSHVKFPGKVSQFLVSLRCDSDGVLHPDPEVTEVQPAVADGYHHALSELVLWLFAMEEGVPRGQRRLLEFQSYAMDRWADEVFLVPILLEDSVHAV